MTAMETQCCASCHFGVDGDGETVYCNWTGNKRMPKDACCESYDGEHPDTDYFRRQAEAAEARVAKLEADLAVEQERNAFLQKLHLPEGVRELNDTLYGAQHARVVAAEDAVKEPRRLLEAICVEFEGTILEAENNENGRRGMQVPFHGDFCMLVQFPTVIAKFRWWVREFRKVLGKGE
jgi:hypothetical protein